MNLFPNLKTKPQKLICKKCGHKVGLVKPRLKFHVRLIAIAFGIAVVIEIIAQIISDIILR